MKAKSVEKVIRRSLVERRRRMVEEVFGSMGEGETVHRGGSNRSIVEASPPDGEGLR